jgi:hypothetical protein
VSRICSRATSSHISTAVSLIRESASDDGPLGKRVASCTFAGPLPDEVGPEAVSGRGRDAVEIEDGDQGTQEDGGPVVEWLRIHAIEQFAAEVLDARRLMMVGHVVNDAKSDARRLYSQLAIFKSHSADGNESPSGTV